MSGATGAPRLSFGRWVVLRWNSRRYQVEDRSMEPEFLPGDRLLVERRREAAPLPRQGEVVVVQDPAFPDRLLLKRVFRQVPRGPGQPVELDVRGDQASSSRDSRTFGLVGAEKVVGRVWYRYAPPARRGPVAASSGASSKDPSSSG